MTSIFGKHDLMFNRYGEEIKPDDRLDIVDKIRRTFGFNKSYVSLEGRRLVNVEPSVDRHNCVTKEQRADLERKLDEKFNKLGVVGEIVPDRTVIDTNSEVKKRVSRPWKEEEMSRPWREG